MLDRETIIMTLAIALVVVAATALMHDQHYRDRKLQLLQARVVGLEQIITGDHTL